MSDVLSHVTPSFSLPRTSVKKSFGEVDLPFSWLDLLCTWEWKEDTYGDRPTLWTGRIQGDWFRYYTVLLHIVCLVYCKVLFSCFFAVCHLLARSCFVCFVCHVFVVCCRRAFLSFCASHCFANRAGCGRVGGGKRLSYVLPVLWMDQDEWVSWWYHDVGCRPPTMYI